MKPLLVLVVSTQLFQPLLAASFRGLSCSEQGIVKAAELAVEHINANQPGGYKYVLNKIENAQENRGKRGTSPVYFEFEILETRCLALNPKPVAQCEVRSGPEAISGDCKMKLKMNSTTQCIEVHKYWCLISPDSDDMVLSRCPGCPHRMALNHSDASYAAAVGLQKYNQNNNRTNNYAVQEITRASYQMLTGKKIFVEFVIQEASNCQNCPVNEGKFASANKGFCTASVYKPIFGQEKIKVNCEFYRPKVVGSSAKNKATRCVQRRLGLKAQRKRNKRLSNYKKKPGNKRANLHNGTPRRTESSEEVQGALGFVIGTGSRNGFPRLPAPRNTCPGRARHFGGTNQPI
ncbi:fetuin-B-like [Narcine bancroftii]|uniref:fetuin-B-like n=1 Tax=Narcine bancroftii TaxID=1343680 RepID=UPI0038310928